MDGAGDGDKSDGGGDKVSSYQVLRYYSYPESLKTAWKTNITSEVLSSYLVSTFMRIPANTGILYPTTLGDPARLNMNEPVRAIGSFLSISLNDGNHLFLNGTKYDVNKGDALLFDFGATYQGYNADITRTFFIIEADEYQRAAYNNVLEANKIGIKNSIISKTMHDVDNETTLVLETGDYNNFIVHKTGHGLGLDVHEDPYIVRGNNSPLEIGMIITVEPGLYLPGKFGIRIEDDVVITDKDPNVLTSFSKDLRIINNE